ncbi:SAM-dependent methyltransferase [Actinomadura sp. CNU-125]|uniref:class I SAM-dependent methyltransferase n=1 Tax=Actinomadura sp. CNU-125 TaxID=1904961 RepID=UPI00095A8BC1|nr:class I SAM-dependent methyltransferase [Actinomadura sp. CNU-125]OLT24108.1 SAM-dependent methyltransferase [Actinomadura sp. CNU-125]
MNRIETAVINNPARRAVQRWYEAPLLQRLGGPLPERARVLEIGCGPGYGARLILDAFGAARVDAVDLDPAMARRARRRLAPYAGRARVGVSDATDLSALVPENGTYDAVFDFGIIHHIPNWRDALAEVARVLKPGGVFYFEEVTRHALDRAVYRILFDHPEQDRFTDTEFLDALGAHGLHVRGHRTIVFGDFVLGAAQARLNA